MITWSEFTKTNNWNDSRHTKGQHQTFKKTRGKVHTFFNFFILEGGHRPFFLILRLRTSRFLLSLTFFANFILIFCSSLSCIFDSSGSLSTGTTSLVLSEGGSPPSVGAVPSMSEDALTITAPLLLATRGVQLQTPLEDFGWDSMALKCNLETENQRKRKKNSDTPKG